MNKIITTDKAPTAIGTYSQAIQVANLVFVSGQLGVDPMTAQLVSSDFTEQTHQVFKNLLAIAQAAGGELKQFVKLTVYVTDLTHFALLNAVMEQYFTAPYPARAAVEVSALPKGATIEIEGVLALA